MRKIYIIGGGTAGILLTYQLLQQGFAVILIEKGDLSSSIQEEEEQKKKEQTPPTLWSELCNNLQATDVYYSSNQSHLLNRILKYPMGRGLGGTSLINANLHDLGDVTLFDRYWPEAWNSKVIEGLEKELDEIVPKEIIQTESELLQEYLRLLNPSVSSASSTPEQQQQQKSSYYRIPDVIKRSQNNIEYHRERWKMSSLLLNEDGFLKEEFKDHLEIIQGKVQKLEFRKEDNKEGRKLYVKSILFQDGRRISIDQDQDEEVILSAGVFTTPQILLNSGITAVHQQVKGETRRYVDIGENLQDHCLMGTMYWGRWKPSTGTLPSNCVHGIVYLDDKGYPVDSLQSNGNPW